MHAVTRVDTCGMDRPVPLRLIVAAALFAAPAGCVSPPEPPPQSPARPAPAEDPAAAASPTPVETPDAEPQGPAPLIGSRWLLTRLYADMRRLDPTEREVWIEFYEDGTFAVQGPVSDIRGRVSHSPEEGTLLTDDIERRTPPGAFSDFEDALMVNLAIIKGYAITGESHAESRLSVWGGFRTEEVVLMELIYDGTARGPGAS